jgi:hypothetical protein
MFSRAELSRAGKVGAIQEMWVSGCVLLVASYACVIHERQEKYYIIL